MLPPLLSQSVSHKKDNYTSFAELVQPKCKEFEIIPASFCSLLRGLFCIHPATHLSFQKQAPEISTFIPAGRAIGTIFPGTNNIRKIPFKAKVKTGKPANGLRYFILQHKKPENKVELRIIETVKKPNGITETDLAKARKH